MPATIVLGLLVGGFVGSVAGYLGSIMVSRHMALVGDALSHVALPGLALGILFNFNPFAGAFAILALTAIATWYLQKSSSLSLEAIIGVLFVLALAIGILITPQVDLLEALFGDVSKVTLTDAILVAPVSVIVVLVTRRIYNQLVLSMISRELAISRGVRAERIDLVYLLLVSAVVALGIKEVGTLLVGAVVIVPAAAARNVSSTLHRYALTSSLFGLVSALSGVTLSGYVNLPAGPLVVIAGTTIFALGLIVRWAHRWRYPSQARGTLGNLKSCPIEANLSHHQALARLETKCDVGWSTFGTLCVKNIGLQRSIVLLLD